MLNFVEISNRIDHPELIKLEDLESLRQLAESYPFTALFSQLYLKGLAMHNTIQFEGELKNHAYRIPDRTQLFHLVHYVNEVLSEENTNDTPHEEHIDQPSIADREGQDELTLGTEEEPSVPDVNSLSPEDAFKIKVDQEEQEFTAETSKEKEESVTEGNEEGGVHKTTPEETRGKDSKRVGDLERDILAHAISSSIYLEVDKESEETYSFARLKQLDEPKEFEKELAAIEFDLPSHEDDSVKDQQQDEVQTEDGVRKTFTSWMSPFLKEEKSNDTSKKQIEIPRKEIKTEKIEEEKEKNKEISRVEKRKSEFFSPLQKARESIDESRLPVSETLAKVYVAQGNYPKAIVAYDKLMLKFPEKKSFFALQIETLKRKLN